MTTLEPPASVSIRTIPLWVKSLYTMFVGAIAVTYACTHDLTNFLWFSHLILLASAVAIWLENRLLVSMLAVGGLLPELGWNIDFWVGVAAGGSVTGATGYMFDAQAVLWRRAISLFHVALPPVLLWMVSRTRYDRRALPAQTVVCWVVLIVTYVVTDPDDNINWAFGPVEAQAQVHSLLYLAALMLFFPIGFYLPTHLLLGKWLSARPIDVRRAGTR